VQSHRCSRPVRRGGWVAGHRVPGYLEEPGVIGGDYHEYTVKTPGENDRRARRIVTGTGDWRYYTDDHYKSFRRIQADVGTDG